MSNMNIINQEIYGDVIASTVEAPANSQFPLIVPHQMNNTEKDPYAVLLSGTANVYDPNGTLIFTCNPGHTDDTVPMTYEKGTYIVEVGGEVTEHICFSKVNPNDLIIREEVKMIPEQSISLENKKCILVVSGDVLLNGVPISGPYVVGVHSPSVQVVSQTDSFVIGIK